MLRNEDPFLMPISYFLITDFLQRTGWKNERRWTKSAVCLSTASELPEMFQWRSTKMFENNQETELFCKENKSGNAGVECGEH